MNETDSAIKEYESLVDTYSGDEARCRYALALKRNGNSELARQTFEKIAYDAKHSPRYYRRYQKKWINIAREKLLEFQQQVLSVRVRNRYGRSLSQKSAIYMKGK